MYLNVEKYCVDPSAGSSHKEMVKSSRDTLTWEANSLAWQFPSSRCFYTYFYSCRSLFFPHTVKHEPPQFRRRKESVFSITLTAVVFAVSLRFRGMPGLSLRHLLLTSSDHFYSLNSRNVPAGNTGGKYLLVPLNLIHITTSPSVS